MFHINDFFGGGKEQFELTLISNIKEMIIKIHEEFTALEYLGLIILNKHQVEKLLCRKHILIS